MDDIRAHRSSRMDRERLLLEIRRSFRPGLVVLFGIAAAILGAAFLVVHISKTAFSSSREMRFTVDDATGAVAGVQEVRFKGIPAGTITRVDLDGARPVLTVQLKKEFGPIYRDARAELRPNTPLQDLNLNIVDPGTPGAGEASPSRPLPAEQTDTSVRIDEVLNTFDANTRLRLRTLLDGLGNGLADNGASLREAFVEAVPLLRNAGKLTDELGAHAQLTRQLVHNTGLITSELARRDGEVRRLVQETSVAMGAVQAKAGDLDAILRELPPTLTALDSSFTATRGVLDDVDGALTGLQPVAEKLPESLSAIRRLSDSAEPTLQALQSPVRRLVPFATALTPLSADLAVSLRRLQPQISAVDRLTKALAACPKQINNFFQYDASFSKFSDARGPFPRGNVSVPAGTVGVNVSPFEGQVKSCAPGVVIAGRPATEADKG